MIYKIKDWRFVTKKRGLKEKKLGGQVLNYLLGNLESGW